jgi:hypothetical protein
MPDFYYPEIPVDVLREICARTYYTIDGLWFLAVENKFDFETAFELNQVVWQQASPIIGRRILKNLDMEGLTPLQALSRLIYADPLLSVHRPEVVILSDTKAVLRLIECPIQIARIRDGKGVYDGIPGCSFLFEAYAEIIDPSINVKCVACAPNPDAPEYWCEWEFEISDGDRLESAPT